MILRVVTGTLLALALLASPAAAQVHAPSMVEDDLPQEEPARQAPPARPGEPVPEPRPPPPAEPILPPSPAPRPAAPDARAPRAAMPGVTISVEEIRKLQRPIEPVRSGYGRILEAWQARRAALREHDLTRAAAAQTRMLETQRELAIENLTLFAAALVREAERALAARSPEDAVRSAAFATELAPDLADGHLALARARLDKEPTRPLAVAGELRAALTAAAREPHTLRALYGDLFGAGLAALFTAAAAAVILLFARRLRLFLHDFRHLPVVRGGAPVQAGFLALVLLALPLVFRLGPFAVLFVLALSAWLYLSARERAVATVALLALVALPWLARAAAGATAWTGTLAEEIFELEHGSDPGELAARLEARAATKELPAPALTALGRHHKRRGDLATALRWYERAAAADGGSAEVQVNLGNALFLRGDLDGAKSAYLAATDRAQGVTTLAAAHYNLSKLYLRLAAVEQSTEARKKAQQEDPAYIARYGSDDDFRANRYLVDVTVPEAQLSALTRADDSARAVGEAVRARLAGPIPAPLWPWGPVALTLVLWPLGLAGRGLGASPACERCGHPACRRCGGVAADLCGQCVNVFMRQGLVDARDRLRKESQVRRHRQWRQLVTRVLAVVGGGAGHLASGEPVRGSLFLLGLLFPAFVVLFWRGVLPPPHTSPYAIAVKLAVAVPVGLALYAFAVVDAFKRGGD